MVEGPKAVYFQKELLMKPRATAHQPEADVLRAVSPQPPAVAGNLRVWRGKAFNG